jgi:tetratricopeptide (TPR) repeat protein
MGDEEAELVYDVLENLEKTLPPIDVNVVSFSNDKPQHANNLYLNQYKVVPAKFPLETLQVEIDERNAKNLAESEKRRIERAKKPKKRNARDPPPKEIYMDELPNKKVSNERYLGKEKTKTLTKNNVKNTFKEIVSNTKVYPSLIHESLILPKILPDKIKELIIASYKDHIHGHTEFAIRRLERAEYFLKDFKLPNEPQIELFFSLTFGSFYQELNYNITALKYYFNARKITDKLLSDNPDSALVYCYLGSLFLDMKEFIWAFRCFQFAKEWREKTIGGDTLDTAAIYNNLGVVAFYMESFLPSKNYLNLAYEITRSILGLGHPRTLFIKSNFSKLSQLSFNKEVVFKTLGKYPALSQLIQNPKRAKKKKK